MQERSEGKARNDTDQQAKQNQKLDRTAHPMRRLVRLMRQVMRWWPEKRRIDETYGIGDRENTGNRGDVRRDRIEPGRQVRFNSFSKEHFLGNEAIEQRHARHGCTRHHGERCRIGHGPQQPAQLAHVAGAGLMVDDARGHKQRCLENRMVDHVEDCSNGGKRTAKTKQNGNQAKVADGRIGKQAFEVLLENREEAGNQKRDETGRTNDPEPLFRSAENRPQARQQEHACLHHGCRMQIGRYGCWRRHGIGKPEVERKLRTFRKGPEQDQDERHAVKRMRPHDIARCQNLVEIVASDNMAQDQNACEQAESADTRYGQCHAGTVTGAGIVIPIADQQEREDAGQLPEHGQQYQITGQNHAEHRSHEGQKEREEPRHRIFGRHVITRINDDQQANARDEHSKKPGKAVHPKGDIEAIGRKPFHSAVKHLAVRHNGIKAGGYNKGDERNRCRKPGRTAAISPPE